MRMIEEKKSMATMIESWHQRLRHDSKEKPSKVDFLKNNSVNFSNETCDSCA